MPDDWRERLEELAELYEGTELPGVLVRPMKDTLWCDEVKEYVPMDDPARLILTPQGGM